MTEEITQEDAQRAATQHQQLSSLASALAPPKTGCSACLVKGVVTAYTYPYITVQVDGDTSTSIENVRHLEAYSPVVGDTCSMLKQGSDLLAIGRVNTTTASPALNGWVTPTLGTGITAPLDTVRYRIINDNGDRKMQMRGKVAVSGTNTTLFTLPAGSRPILSLEVLAARNIDGGSTAVQIAVNASTGVVSLSGVTTGLKDTAYLSGNPRTGLQSSVPQTSTSGVDIGHSHKFLNLDWGSTDGYRNADSFPYYWETSPGNGVPRSNHSHAGGDHQHYMDAVDHPTSVSLNGVEFFL
jgi:hypothetical protein